MHLEHVLLYTDFVTERHRIWQQRQATGTYTTDDAILATRKFTNVFRVLDPGTQFFVEHLMAGDARDTLARAVLYRLTNLPATWQYMHYALGYWPGYADLTPDLGEVLVGRRETGQRVFSGAYVILPRPGVAGVDKAREVVTLTREVVDAVWPDFAMAGSLAERYAVLNSAPGMGPFLSMQVVTDYGYSDHVQDEENTFVVAGPGSRRGAQLVQPGWKPERTIAWAGELLASLDDAVALPLPCGGQRPPSLMDLQNTFCEFFKYHRYWSSPAPAGPRPYVPAHPGQQPTPKLPTHWKAQS